MAPRVVALFGGAGVNNPFPRAMPGDCLKNWAQLSPVPSLAKRRYFLPFFFPFLSAFFLSFFLVSFFFLSLAIVAISVSGQVLDSRQPSRNGAGRSWQSGLTCLPSR